MLETLTPDTLRELLQADDAHALNARLEDTHPRTISEAAAELDDQTLWTLLHQLDPPLNADVFSHLTPRRQVELAVSMEPHDTADLLEEMPSDDRVDLVQQLDPETREDILSHMEEPERREVERLEGHAEGTVGSVMSTEVATLKADMTVNAAIARLRRLAAEKETIYYNYVVDADGRLLGIVSLRDLVLAEEDAHLHEVMNEEFVSVKVNDPVTDAARLVMEYDLIALPVVDSERRLVGIVTVDDVLDFAEEEVNEDFDRIAAVAPVRPGLRDASFWLLYRKRIPWLLVLVFVNLLSGAGIAYFQDTITRMVALVFFLPLLIGSGGNAGAQAATLMVRALATGEVLMRDWLRLLGKEVLVALALGLTMAVGVAFVAQFRAREAMMVVAVTMVLVVTTGSLIGMMMPFVFTKLRMDPATASGPLITSLADICGVLIYFGTARWLLDHSIGN